LISEIDRGVHVVVVPLVRGVDDDPPAEVYPVPEGGGHLVPADRRDCDVGSCGVVDGACGRTRAQVVGEIAKQMLAAQLVDQ
jgi:hypothetical protein